MSVIFLILNVINLIVGKFKVIKVYFFYCKENEFKPTEKQNLFKSIQTVYHYIIFFFFLKKIYKA